MCRCYDSHPLAVHDTVCLFSFHTFVSMADAGRHLCSLRFVLKGTTFLTLFSGLSSQLENGASSRHLPPNSEHRRAGEQGPESLKKWVRACYISLLWKCGRKKNHKKTGSKLDKLARFHLKNKRIKKRAGDVAQR